MEKFSLEAKLQSIKRDDLCNLVKYLLEKGAGNRKLVLEWFKKKVDTLQEKGIEKELTGLNDKLLFEYWSRAERIISNFNEYGGGPEELEEQAYEWLRKISELARESNFSPEAKIEFLDEAFIEYNKNNSGFEDRLIEVLKDICQTKEEWEYLVKKLNKYPSRWRKKLIMDIQKIHLKDDAAYLEERLQNLRYGMDYWDLIEFYLKNNNRTEALKIAEQGLKEGEGWLTELFDFLFEHYRRKNDIPNMERIVQISLQRGTEQKNMLERLFEYYKKKGNYEKAQESLVKSCDFLQSGYYNAYQKLQKFLKQSDWEEIEPDFLKKIKEKDIFDYLKICMNKGWKKIVLDTLMEPPKNKWGYPIMLNSHKFEQLAEKLCDDYPEQIIEYFWKKAYSNIANQGSRKTYRIAAGYLKKVKKIYTKILQNKTKWQRRFNALKSEFSKRPAFLAEVSRL